jgi:hypothetical protein
MVQPNYDASTSFLELWQPEGPWVLTAILPDRREKGIETRTFRDLSAVREWLEDLGEKRNIYFHVNPTTKDLSKKALRTEIASLAWLHVDVDPRVGEDLEEEQRRALTLLRDPPGNLPPPTAIVFSGGGYQGFWKLEDPLPIGGDLAIAEDAKRYNLQIELLFGADNCHNVDRIMRLPGTVNRPDAKKRKKGREEALATLIEWAGHTYKLSDFTPAPAVQKADDGFSGGKLSVSGNVQRFNCVEDLPEKVPNWCRVLVVNGEDPENPAKFESRSECLWAVCCELVRCELTVEQIYAVITDPDFRISDSVLDKKSGAERYALRQIERALEHAVDPWLATLNEKHAVISDIGGKCRVISEPMDRALGRPRITRQSFDDFRNRYMNKLVKVGHDEKKGPIYMQLGKWWLGHEKRRQYETIVFAPGQELEDTYNLWRGFACEAIPGDCSLFLDHVRENVCSGDEAHYEYLVGWMASAVQCPDTPGHAAVVMRGKMGTGKGVFAKMFGSLWGRHFLQISDPKHLVGSFNAHLRDCVVLFGDEAFWAGDKKHESVLKMLVTEEMLAIEPKGFDVEVAPNYLHIIMASNEDWVVPAGVHDRRFFVLDVSDERIRDTSYFQRLSDQMEGGGREALLYYLMTYDLTDFDVRVIPDTAALAEQKMMSLGPQEKWWFDKLSNGKLDVAAEGWQVDVPCQVLATDFLEYMKTAGRGPRYNGCYVYMRSFLKRVLPDGYPRRRQRTRTIETTMPDGSRRKLHRPYYWVFPSLQECRDYWDEEFGGPWDWSEVEVLDEDDPNEHKEF